jgi:anti-sigma-K factor RskA
MNTINRELERREIEALLPWYAAGTLSRRDADRVEQTLAGDCELARRYDLVRKELAETILLNETLGAPRRARWKNCSPRSRPGRHVRRAVSVAHYPSAIAGDGV